MLYPSGTISICLALSCSHKCKNIFSKVNLIPDDSIQEQLTTDMSLNMSVLNLTDLKLHLIWNMDSIWNIIKMDITKHWIRRLSFTVVMVRKANSSEADYNPTTKNSFMLLMKYLK